MNIKDLIGEATEYDKKLALEEKKPKSWCKSVSAFANTFGGALIFGISDDDQVIGLDDPKGDADKISEAIKARLDPIPEFKLRFHKTEDWKVLVILDVYKGDETPYYYSGDGGMQMNIQELATAIVYELPIIICILNNGYLGNVRQWQEMFFAKRYSGTCMRYRKSCDKNCNMPGEKCPEYTPDFIRLAESYGAKAVRVTKEEEIEAAFAFAKKNQKAPIVIEFIIDREANVMPIVPPGNALKDMIMERKTHISPL